MWCHLTLVTMHIKKNSKVMVEFEEQKGIFIDLLMKWKPVTLMVHNSIDSLKDNSQILLADLTNLPGSGCVAIVTL